MWMDKPHTVYILHVLHWMAGLRLGGDIVGCAGVPWSRHLQRVHQPLLVGSDEKLRETSFFPRQSVEKTFCFLLFELDGEKTQEPTFLGSCCFQTSITVDITFHFGLFTVQKSRQNVVLHTQFGISFHHFEKNGISNGFHTPKK